MKVNQNLLFKLLCVAFVAGVMLPTGGTLFPYVNGILNMTQFHMLEAVATTGLGLGLSSLLG